MQKYDIFFDIQTFFIISLCQLAVFNYGSWQFFIMPVGSFSLCQLAIFHYASWQFFIVSVGNFSLCQLAIFHYGSWQFFLEDFYHFIGSNLT